MLIFDAVLMLTGRDPAQDLRGVWRDALGATRTLNLHGGWAAVMAQRVGPEVAPADAAQGDVLLLSAGVCTDEMASVGALAVRWADGGVAQGPNGLVAVPLSSAVRAWRVA